jgi:hypothetical protein
MRLLIYACKGGMQCNQTKREISIAS